MNISQKEANILFIGDVIIFFVSLWFALLARHLQVPTWALYTLHLKAFAVIFILSVIVFYIAGVYEKHTLVFKTRLPRLLITAEIVNSALAVLFFYVIPYLSIAPKTVLLIYIVFSFLLLAFWHLFLSERLIKKKKQKALLIGSGSEMKDLESEVNQNSRYPLQFISSFDLLELKGLKFEELRQAIERENVSIVVMDLRNERYLSAFPEFYDLLFSKVQFFDLYRMYEDIFDRIPLSLVGYNWFLENISSASKISYDILKRLMDVGASFILGIISLLFYPFIILAIKIDDGGKVFIHQERVGKNNESVWLLKFRTMEFDDKGKWEKEGKKNVVTRAGRYLRRSRLDEIPQLWNVLFGDISLIGPRPEFPEAVAEYEKSLPYYAARHLIKPGLSGWAQTHHAEHPHHSIDIKETERKLSYDLYYLKNRSFILDIKIALQTVRTLLSRSGR